MRISKVCPSPGVLVGTIALVFALSGAAVASNGGKVQTADIAKVAESLHDPAAESVEDEVEHVGCSVDRAGCGAPECAGELEEVTGIGSADRDVVAGPHNRRGRHRPHEN